MYKLRRRTLHAFPVESAVAVSAEALTAATVGPMPLTDAAVIAQLRQQLAARPDPVSNCSGCVGYRQVIADLREEMRGLRRRFMELHLAAPGERERTWAAPYAARED